MTTDWSKLRHARGPATRVPAQIKRLAAKNSDNAEEAFDELRTTLVGDGEWFEASAPALDALMGALPKAVYKNQLLVLVAEIVGADHVRAWLAPVDAEPPASIIAPLLDHRASLLAASSSPDASTRAAALLVLGTAPSIAREVLPSIVERASSDGDPIAQASALLALGRLGEGRAEVLDRVKAMQGGGVHDVVRGAATLARLRLEPSRTVTEEADGVAAWLRWPIPRGVGGETEFPWFGGLPTAWYALRSRRRFGEDWFLRGTSLGLVELATQRGAAEALSKFALELGAGGPPGPLTKCAGEIALEVSGLTANAPKNNPLRFVALPDELEPTQRELARSLASTTLLPEAGFGLPACGAARRRWLGLDPPGPLDRPVELEPGRTVPFWRAWRELVERGIYGEPIPPPIDGVLAGIEHWQALVEQSVHTYGGPYKYLEPEAVEVELARATNPDLPVRAARIADDLAARFEVMDAEGRFATPFFTTSALLLLPLVRSARALEPRWDRLVSFGAQPQAREILATIPKDRREAIVWRRLAAAKPFDMWIIGDVVAVLDLAPSRRIAEDILRRLKMPAVREFLKTAVDEHLRRIQDLAREHESLGEALEADG